jgi:hypothetical protein
MIFKVGDEFKLQLGELEGWINGLTDCWIDGKSRRASVGVKNRLSGPGKKLKFCGG